LPAGAARRLGPREPGFASAEAALVGTPGYTPPEQRGNGLEVDRQIYIWACGLLLHRLICGCHTARPRLPMPSMRQLAPPEVPDRLIELVDRCPSQAKDQRWQGAGEPARALLPLRAGGPAAVEPLALPGDVQPPAVLPATSSPSHTGKHTILCLASDSEADGSSQLNRQAAAIRKELERSCARDRFDVVTQLAAEPIDLLRALRKLKPTVVYFAGNSRETIEYHPGQALVGDRFGGLFFRGRGGRPQFLSPSSVQETFGAAGQSVRLVVLSGCYVDLQAEALLMHVDCVVGTRGTVQPEATQVYAIGFMGALGDRESIAAAHKQACAAIHLEGLEVGEPPQMKVRSGVDAHRLVLAARP